MRSHIKVMISAVGAPGCSTLIRKIRDNGERKVTVIGIDSEEEIIGNFYSDIFYHVPKVSEKQNYLETIFKIIKKEKPEIFYPVSSVEVPIISQVRDELEALGTKVCVSNFNSISLSENKFKLYQLLKDHNLPVPDFKYPKTLDQFVQYAKELGYPKKQICFKPHISKGSRGFRIIDDTISRKDLLLNYKPESRYISMDEFIDIFKNEKIFPDLILMEMVKGDEYDVMSLCDNGQSFITSVKSREKNRWGVITLGELIKNDEILEISKKIISLTGLSYNISLQFITNKLIEINARPSTFIYHKLLNEPYLAIKYILGEISIKELEKIDKNIPHGVRMIRYMDQIFYEDLKSRNFYS